MFFDAVASKKLNSNWPKLLVIYVLTHNNKHKLSSVSQTQEKYLVKIMFGLILSDYTKDEMSAD